MKFSITVFLAPVSPELVMPALTAALAPFDYNDYAREPFDVDAAWDWWQLPEPAVPKRLVDFDAIRRAARDHAAGTWDAWADVARAHPGALPRAHFEETYDEPAGAQRAWLLQPAIQDLAQAAATQEHPYFTFSLLNADPVVHLAGDRGRFLDRAAAEAIATHAYLTLDGQWFSEYTDDRGWDAHVLAMDAYLDAVPEDALIAQVRCHI